MYIQSNICKQYVSSLPSIPFFSFVSLSLSLLSFMPSSFLGSSPLILYIILDEDYHILRRTNLKTCHKEWFNNIQEHDKGVFTLRSKCRNLRDRSTPQWTLLSYPRLNPSLKIGFFNHEEYFHVSFNNKIWWKNDATLVSLNFLNTLYSYPCEFLWV